MSASGHVLAAEGGAHTLIPATGEVVIGLIAFGILCFVLMRFAFPRIEATYTARRDVIVGGIQRAEEEQAKAHEAFETYTRQLAEAQQEAARFREEARADAQRIREEAQAQAVADAARLTAAAEDRLAAERAGIVAELRREIGGLATDLAERILGHELAQDSERQRQVEAFIAELDGQPAAASPGPA